MKRTTRTILLRTTLLLALAVLVGACDSGGASSTRRVEDMTAAEAREILDKTHRRYGEVPFLLYMREGNIRKVKLHLKAGMNPDTVDKHGLLYRGYRNTPVLLYAAHWGSPEIALALIKAGADVTVRDRNEMTPLMHAVLRDEPELVKALIEAGADVNASVRNNMTVLVYAVLARRIDPEDAFTGLLMDAVTGLNAELHGGGRRRGASPSPNDTDIQDSTECLKLLLEAGVDIDAQTGHGETALMYAARTGRFEKAQLLLEYGADPNVTNVQGETALDMAKKGRHGEILKLLKQVDAKK